MKFVFLQMRTEIMLWLFLKKSHHLITVKTCLPYIYVLQPEYSLYLQLFILLWQQKCKLEKQSFWKENKNAMTVHFRKKKLNKFFMIWVEIHQDWNSASLVFYGTFSKENYKSSVLAATECINDAFWISRDLWMQNPVSYVYCSSLRDRNDPIVHHVLAGR